MGFCTSFILSCSHRVALVQRSDRVFYKYSPNLRAVLFTEPPTDTPAYEAKLSELTLMEPIDIQKYNHIYSPPVATPTRINKPLNASLTTDFVNDLTQKTVNPKLVQLVGLQVTSEQVKSQQVNISPHQPKLRRNFLNWAMLFMIVGLLFLFFFKGWLRVLGTSLQVIGVIFIILGIKLK